MAHIGYFKVGTALTIIFAVFFTQNHVYAEDKCRSGCMGTPQTFKYVEGTTYKYKFDSKVEITLSSAEGQKTTTEVKGTVLLSQKPECNQVLKLQNVQVIGADGKKHPGQIPDIDKPIRINFHDGHIEDSICTTTDDSENSLNIKRAIASLFQINLNKKHETDIFGLCPTDINQHKEGQILIITKTRNLNKCAYRENIKSDFITTSFNLNSELKSSPLLNGDLNGKIKIKNGILEQVNLIENYLYVPFSVGKNGAKAQIETKLQFIGTIKENIDDNKVIVPKTIIFENPHTTISPKSNVNSIMQSVKDVTKTVKLTVNDKTAKEFVNLVKILRVSSKDDLLSVYNQVKAGIGFDDKVTAKKLFLDALLRAGNGNNVEVVLELIKNNELNQIEQRLVYIGLSLVRHSTKSLITMATSLLDQKDLPREAYLGIGTLAGRYCKQHNCHNIDVINKLQEKLIKKLDKSTSDKEKENDVIYALKALSNINHINDVVLNKITAIGNDKKVANRIRVAALAVYMSDPCKFRDSALNLLKDIQQDSEIRIKSYLVLVQCPNAKIGNAIKVLLENEPSYQVGGFIVSHIKNLRSSANHDKELAKQHLGFIHLPKKYPVDYRKWSFNTEFSYDIDTLGLGNSIESNIIYSQQSYIPRSTTLNLTSELFGHKLNLIEIDGRQENFDRLIEHYLGPKGVLRGQTLQELWNKNGKQGKEYYEKFTEQLSKHLRAKRDIGKVDIDHTKQIMIKTNELNKDLDLDLSIKTFGAEILHFNINDNINKYSPDIIIDKIIQKFDEGIEKLKNFDETVRFNLLVLDGELSYPTASGFPIKLGLEGVANGQIKVAGNIDVKSLLNPNNNNNVKLSLIPSANVLVTGRLTIDTLLVENGLKVASNLYTSTGLEANIDLFNNPHRGIDIKLSTPMEKQTVLSAKHDIVFHTRELGLSEHNVPLKFAQNKDFEICIDQLNPLIGLTFCAEYNGPNLAGKIPQLPFPLAGDAKLGITIEREDIKELHIKNLLYNKNDKNGIEFLIETIDKNNKPKVSLNINGFLLPEKYIKISVISPIKNAELDGKIINNLNEKSVQLKLQYDQLKYFSKIGVDISGTDSRSIYKPIIEYQNPNSQAVLPYHIEGQVVVEKGDGGRKVKYQLDNVKFIMENHKTINVNGNFGHEFDELFADLKLTDGSNNGEINGKIKMLSDLIQLNGYIKNTLNPQINVKLLTELKRKTDEIQAKVQLIHGDDFNTKVNKLDVESELKYNIKEKIYKTKNSLNYPLLGVNAKVNIEKLPNKFEYEIDLKYKEINLNSEFDLEYNKNVIGDYDMELKLNGLGQNLKIDSKREIKGDESKITQLIKLNDKKLELKGKIKHHVKPQDLDIGADLILKLNDKEYKIINGLMAKPNELNLNNKIISDGKTFMDILLNANKNNINGYIKINLIHLNVNGEIKSIKGDGNGNLLIDLMNKQVKIDTTFTIQDPIYNINLDLYPVYNDDKNNKISFKIQSKYLSNRIEFKNILNANGYEVNIIGKCDHEGDFYNGKSKWELEGKLLPNNLIVKLNGNHEKTTTKTGIINGNFAVSLNHNHFGTVTLNGNIKNTSIKERIWDVYYLLNLNNNKGKDLNVDLSVKRLKDPQNGVTVEWKNKVWGSIMENQIENLIKGTHNHGVGNYVISSSANPKLSLTVKGNYDLSMNNDNKVSGDIDVNFKTPTKLLKTTASGSIIKKDLLNLKSSGSIYAENDNKKIIDLNGNIDIDVNTKNGKIKTSIKYDKIDSLSIDLDYNRNIDEKEKSLNGMVSIMYGKNNIKSELKYNKPSEHEYKLDLKLNLPLENHKNNHLEVYGKRVDRKFIGKLTVNSDGKEWTKETLIDLNEFQPMIDIKIKNPDNKLIQLYGKINRIDNNLNQLNGDVKLINELNNFKFESSLNSNIENIDNFNINLKVNCPNCQLNNIVIDAQNKETPKTGKKIQINVRANDKNVLQGSSNYQSREENGKLTIEGSGTFKLNNEENKSGNFKFIRKNIQTPDENGIEISFDAGLDNKAIDSELKITNKQFRIMNSYCEEKKQCAHLEIDSKLNINKFDINQELEITIDLRKLGLSYEFGIKAVTNKKNYIFDHNVDVHFQSQKNKYQYSLYLHEKQFGASLTTPKRIIALEGNLNKNFNDNHSIGNGNIDIVFYLDKKNQPKQKSSINGKLDYDLNTRKVNGQLQLTSPGLKRPITISTNTDLQDNSMIYTINFDVFSQPNQKLTLINKMEKIINQDQYKLSWSSNINSNGLNININMGEDILLDKVQKIVKFKQYLNHKIGNNPKYDSEFDLNGSMNSLNILIKLLNNIIVNLDNKFNLNSDISTVDTNLKLFNDQLIQSKFELKNLNTMKLIAKPLNLQINSALILGQIGDFRAQIDGKPLVHFSVQLDESNFLKTDYGLDSNNIKNHLLEPIRKEADVQMNKANTLGKTLAKTIEDEVKEMGEVVKKSQPNLKPIKEYYINELNKIKEEILMDKNIKELSELLHNVIVALTNVFGNVYRSFSDFIENVSLAFNENFSKIMETIQKSILPTLKEIADNLLKVARSIFENVKDMILTMIGKAMEILEKYQPQLKKLATLLSETNQEIGKFLIKIYQQISTIIKEQMEKILNEIKALPIFDEIKQQFEQFTINNDGIKNIIKDLLTTIKDIVPNDELKNIIEQIRKYIEMKLNNEKVNDFNVIENIVKSIVEFINNLIQGANEQIKLPNFQQYQLPLPLILINKLPRLAAIRLSPISYLLNEDLPDYSLFIKSLINRPRNLVPPFPLYGLLAQGQHIFTFDGRHLTYPGKCNYLLAKDAVDGNFTVIGGYTNGILTSITLSDKSGDSVTLKKGGQILLNHQPTESPARKSTIAIYRDYVPTTLVTSYGVEIMCGIELLVCSVRVSGFYHGKIRGLLGNGNNEPYDDFTLPNGKIITSESDFGNSYKTQTTCPTVQTVDHNGHNKDIESCNKLFGWESELRFCYPFVNTENFKMACEHGVAAGVKDTEWAIATAYVAACNRHNIPIHVPSQFVKCHNGENPVEVGDKFSVKTGKSADIVLVIDTIKSNEPIYKELIQPLVQQLTNELHGKGISDIEYHIITWNGENQWPSHITVAGKLQFKNGKAPNLKFSDIPTNMEQKLVIGHEKIDQLIEIIQSIVKDVKLATGQDLQAKTYETALKYPFRANSIKSVIAVVSKPCPIGRLLSLQILRTLLYKDDTIKINLITPFSESLLKDSKHSKDIVGFNDQTVFTIKKSTKNEQLLKDLKYNDYCVDFTLKNNGNIYVTDNFINAKGTTKKQFIQITTNTLVEQFINNKEQHLDCECKYVSAFTAANKCKLVKV